MVFLLLAVRAAAGEGGITIGALTTGGEDQSSRLQGTIHGPTPLASAVSDGNTICAHAFGDG